MATELPGWTDYTVTTGPESAKYLEQSGTALGGLRIMDLGDGVAALDAEAVKALARQPEDANGHVQLGEEGYGHLIWLDGTSYPLEPSFGTGISAERSREADEALVELEEGVTYGSGTHPAGEPGPVLSHEDARKVSEALQDLLRGIGREAGLYKLAPAADTEVPRSRTMTSASRCLITRAALGAITVSEGQVPPGTVRAAAMRTTADGFGAWVEWLQDVTPVALAAFCSEDGGTLTIALWAEVREQVLGAVAAYNETMADRDWLGESI
jgi:hypothetical protein